MQFARRLVSRDDIANTDYATADHKFTPSVTNLSLALLTLIFFALGLAGILYFLRKRRAANAEVLPTHQRNSNHHRLTITATPYTRKIEATHVYGEKRNLIENSCSPPDSPVPEIRITFPDEEDQSGKKKDGRVVVLRIGDSGSVGMEPIVQDPLPPYQSNETERFQSLDLERMGGLREKAEPRRWS